MILQSYVVVTERDITERDVVVLEGYTTESYVVVTEGSVIEWLLSQHNRIIRRHQLLSTKTGWSGMLPSGCSLQLMFDIVVHFSPLGRRSSRLMTSLCMLRPPLAPITQKLLGSVFSFFLGMFRGLCIRKSCDFLNQLSTVVGCVTSLRRQSGDFASV